MGLQGSDTVGANVDANVQGSGAPIRLEPTAGPEEGARRASCLAASPVRSWSRQDLPRGGPGQTLRHLHYFIVFLNKHIMYRFINSVRRRNARSMKVALFRSVPSGGNLLLLLPLSPPSALSLSES